MVKMKIAVYTAIFGDKDVVREPIGVNDTSNVDYFLITDNPNLKSESYHIIIRPIRFDDITKNARYYKIIGLDLFNDYDYVIWHDANLQLYQDKIFEIIKKVENNGIAFFKHPQRNCLYDEAIECIKINKDRPLIILQQIIRYFLLGMKAEEGLYETSIVAKNNQLINKDFLKNWFKEVKNNSRRDQISLPYVLKKHKTFPGILKGDRENNTYSIFHTHKHYQYHFASKTSKKPNSIIKKHSITTILILKKYIKPKPSII